MSNNFGYLDIILLAMIAGFIILRLRNILGRKTGHQDKAFSDFTGKKFEQFKKAAEMRDTKPKNEFDAKEKKQFLKGAEIAYETILTSQNSISVKENTFITSAKLTVITTR